MIMVQGALDSGKLAAIGSERPAAPSSGFDLGAGNSEIQRR
jgi:hypothetical protein